MSGNGSLLALVLVWSTVVVTWSQRPPWKIREPCSLHDIATIDDLEELIQLTASSLGVTEMSLLRQLQGHLDEKRHFLGSLQERGEDISTSENLFIPKHGHLLPIPPPSFRLRPFRKLPRRPDNTFFSHLRTAPPPAGVRVQILTDPGSAPFFDVTVTLSPLMSVEDAIRQANIKYSRMVSLPAVSSMIKIRHSQLLQCSIVKGMPGISGFWRIRVLDSDEKVVYDNVCVPSPQELLVEPGMTILLQ
ncbi:uncharacterized protein LOC111087947 [Limulus polyphemus]|uniref:Uncharacterized protein LOC111087947 n=1 Tax=Limulus polyphemus TaxID=6850 RepID=A0ABM1T8D6_LIMPO|nr:uncharacterized protein LOC111087947 [Limulus polyphemus]